MLACQTRLLLQSGYAVRIIAGVVNQTVLRVEAVAIPFMYGGHSQIAPLQAASQEGQRLADFPRWRRLRLGCTTGDHRASWPA
ncbi:MAG: hypothetical protein RMK32_02490 [Anaerolineae bacterium]|nr:hypothetical protein [Thermoflexus sp.]MDW8064485.1 hypothetical protein [Anaerolineae bacterium]